jgi:hypothetical protein
MFCGYATQITARDFLMVLQPGNDIPDDLGRDRIGLAVRGPGGQTCGNNAGVELFVIKRFGRSPPVALDDVNARPTLVHSGPRNVSYDLADIDKETKDSEGSACSELQKVLV